MQEKVLQMCIATRLCLGHEKCHMMMTEGLILGHYISAAGIQVDPTKIQIIFLIPTPSTKIEVRSFLVFFGYYRRFINNFSQISTPLYAITGNMNFIWIDKCDIAFEDLKRLVSTTPILWGPNWDFPFRISYNTSDMAIGVVLSQEEDKKPYFIYYINKNLSPTKLNYTITKKDFLVVIYAINKLRFG